MWPSPRATWQRARLLKATAHEEQADHRADVRDRVRDEGKHPPDGIERPAQWRSDECGDAERRVVLRRRTRQERLRHNIGEGGSRR